MQPFQNQPFVVSLIRRWLVITVAVIGALTFLVQPFSYGLLIVVVSNLLLSAVAAEYFANRQIGMDAWYLAAWVMAADEDDDLEERVDYMAAFGSIFNVFFAVLLLFDLFPFRS